MRGTHHRQTRAERRDRAVARVVAPVSEASRANDPLLHPSGAWGAQALKGFIIVTVAGLLHLVAITAIYGANRVVASIDPGPEPVVPIKVSIVRPPPPPPPIVEPPPPPPPEPNPVDEASEPPPPPPKKKRPKPPPKKSKPPAADPIDLPEKPPPKRKQPRRIAGLSFESTVGGGAGPAFGVGNNRMERTDRVAAEPTEVQRLDPVPSEPRVNRQATRIPGRGRGKVSAPGAKGGRITPEYPPLLRAQNIEGTVTVEVRIDETGRVVSARIVEGSRFEEFQQSALAAARKQRWEPATQGGRPIPYTLTYTYRFRITD